MLFEIIDRGFLGLASVITGSAFRPKAERNVPRQIGLPRQAHIAEEFVFPKAWVRFTNKHLYLLENENGYLIATREKRTISLEQGRYMSPEEAAEIMYAEYFTPEPQPLDRNHRFNRVSRA